MLGTTFAGTTAEGKALEATGGPKKRWTRRDLVARNEKEETVIGLMHQAASSGNVQILRSLFQDSGVNPNLRTDKGWTALLRAAKCNCVEVVELLILEEADLNCQTKQGNSSLHKAAKRGRDEIADMLVRARANINIQNKGGATPLMLAAAHKSTIPVLKVLIEGKADVNIKKDVGYTALMVAARCGNGKAVNALIQDKAEVNAKDNSNETALDKAMKHKNDETVQMMILAGGTSRRQQIASTKSLGTSQVSLTSGRT